MSYRWPLDPANLFAERRPQMLNLGLPAGDVDSVRTAIVDMWADAPGGWVYEWSALAGRYAAEGRHDLAYLAYGWAKFPCLADAAKRAALTHQIREYELASPGFPVPFSRQVLTVAYGDGTTEVPVHLLGQQGRPVLLASGGVDSWKMDIHPLLVQLAQHADVRVMAFDHAGTGESDVPLTAEGGIQIVRGLIEHARTAGNGKVGHFGFSMGGYFAAHSGLGGEVDAAVDLGGPVETGFTADNLEHLMFGMIDIFGNAVGLTEKPATDDLIAMMQNYSLRPLLDKDANAPMLVVNGADDVHVPAADTLVFTGRRDTEVHLIEGTGHVAASKLAEVVPIIIDWLRIHLH
ncbi:esterase FrsA [Catenulispora sp. MAP12-49]|uniref:alpha/beta fold hydrolase n=1 Tax=unclassified Catenulispora TaxID=414885 RepID=UPI003514C831